MYAQLPFLTCVFIPLGLCINRVLSSQFSVLSVVSLFCSFPMPPLSVCAAESDF